MRLLAGITFWSAWPPWQTPLLMKVSWLNFSPSAQRRVSRETSQTVEATDMERRIERPSVPLVAAGNPGPPKIVEIQEKYSAVEGIANNFAQASFMQIRIWFY